MSKNEQTPPPPSSHVTGQSAKLWPGQTVETVLQEMIAVSAGEYEGYDETLDPWTSDNRADIDRWQCIISDASGAQPCALAHISVTDDEIIAELEVLDGTYLQPDMTPVPLYASPAPQPRASTLAGGSNE